ncbi:hypothetical protein [Roseomonas sp. WA12]
MEPDALNSEQDAGLPAPVSAECLAPRFAADLLEGRLLAAQKRARLRVERALELLSKSTELVALSLHALAHSAEILSPAETPPTRRAPLRAPGLIVVPGSGWGRMEMRPSQEMSDGG